jgi:hypothetical protein
MPKFRRQSRGNFQCRGSWHQTQQVPPGTQEGYGGFTIGMSQIAATVRYISNQPRHHAKVSFEDEWKAILDKHGFAE